MSEFNIKYSYGGKSTSPCQQCTDRHFNCHSECEKYITWKAELEDTKSKVKKEINKEAAMNEYKVKRVLKSKKKMGLSK